MLGETINWLTISRYPPTEGKPTNIEVATPQNDVIRSVETGDFKWLLPALTLITSGVPCIDAAPFDFCFTARSRASVPLAKEAQCIIG